MAPMILIAPRPSWRSPRPVCPPSISADVHSAAFVFPQPVSQAVRRTHHCRMRAAAALSSVPSGGYPSGVGSTATLLLPPAVPGRHTLAVSGSALHTFPRPGTLKLYEAACPRVVVLASPLRTSPAATTPSCSSAASASSVSTRLPPFSAYLRRAAKYASACASLNPRRSSRNCRLPTLFTTTRESKASRRDGS